MIYYYMTTIIVFFFFFYSVSTYKYYSPQSVEITRRSNESDDRLYGFNDGFKNLLSMNACTLTVCIL